MSKKIRIACAMAFILTLGGMSATAVAADGTEWQQAYDNFAQTTDPIRQQLDAKYMELAALMNSASPDKNRVQELHREIGDLRGQLVAANIEFQGKTEGAPMQYGGYGMHQGGGYGRCGMGMGGMGGGYGGWRGGHGSMGRGGRHHGGW